MMKQQAKATSAAAPKTPNCNFCKGAGEPESVYTAHWQFSKPVDGKLICPKLLAYTCKKCNMNGHIEKRCLLPAPKKAERTTKFCRHCSNAGYTCNDHNQFDVAGFVICQRLLDTVCRKCSQRGHTQKYCDQVVAETVTTTPIKQQTTAAVKAPNAPKKPITNPYAALLKTEDISSDDEADLRQVKVADLRQVKVADLRQVKVADLRQVKVADRQFKVADPRQVKVAEDLKLGDMSRFPMLSQTATTTVVASNLQWPKLPTTVPVIVDADAQSEFSKRINENGSWFD